MNKRKKIVINASTVLISGGYYLTLNIIHSLIKDDTLELYIVCPNHRKYSSCISDYSHLIIVPNWQLKKVFRLVMDLVWLPGVIKRINPDLVFSVTNIPLKTRYKQIFLHDNPYFLEKDLKQKNISPREVVLQKVRSYFIRRRLKFVNLVMVQSEFFKIRLLQLLGNKTPLKVFSPPIPLDSDLIEPDNPFSKYGDHIKILCLSRYFEHKNIEILIEVGLKIKQQKLPFVIFITLHESHHKNVKAILQKIKTYKLNKYIVNLGKIEYLKTRDYIKCADALILPSYLESFSLNFIEAWLDQKPLVISDIASNRSACVNAALYFDPSDADDIIKALCKLQNPEQVCMVIQNGIQRIKKLTLREDYVELLKSY